MFLQPSVHEKILWEQGMDRKVFLTWVLTLKKLEIYDSLSGVATSIISQSLKIPFFVLSLSVSYSL